MAPETDHVKIVMLEQDSEQVKSDIKEIKEGIKTLTTYIKGNGKPGLETRVAGVETMAKNCPAKTSVIWLTWGFRSLYIIMIGAMLKDLFSVSFF